MAAAWASAPPRSANDLEQLWSRDALYFVPADARALMNWTGVAYVYDAGKCYDLKQEPGETSVSSVEATCPPDILNRARAPYQKISDFEVYRVRLLSCLDRVDKVCLRGLISRSLQISLGVDGFRDRRDLIFERWTPKHYRELAALIRKGVVATEDSKTFPPDPAPGRMRGEFTKVDGGWRLEKYLGGD
jgi:hypothetical protein